MPSTVPKIEVQYYPQPNCSGNLCKIVVEATDLYAAQRMVMSMFNIPERNIFQPISQHLTLCNEWRRPQGRLAVDTAPETAASHHW